MKMTFQNRSQAGELLARRLAERNWMDPLVLALPRGGLPVALPVARSLMAPLDVLVVRKIGAPENPEYGIGAITENGYYWRNPEAAGALGIDEDEFARLARAEFAEVKRRIQKYRNGRSLPDLRGRTVILVDDGFATGVTAAVGTQFVRQQGAREVILAAPVGAPDTIRFLEAQADEVICLQAPVEFSAVGLWYEQFAQLSDEDVLEALRSHADLDPLKKELTFPEHPKAVVLFAHGSGSSRFSPRNRKVARELQDAGFGTLLFDLLTEQESLDRIRVFDIPFLADRLKMATEWTRKELNRRGHPDLPIGYFGASTGAAAALWAAADADNEIYAIVSRGGRPDLALSRLNHVHSPTLLIVGGNDHPVIEMNEEAERHLPSAKLVLVPGATHLFEEPGALEQVSRDAIRWFSAHLISLKKVA